MAICVAPAWAQTYVAPHVTRDGTYVEGHHRSAPNSTRMDNYSTQGNVNPYTGHVGTINPYNNPTPSYNNQPSYRVPQPTYGQQKSTR